MGTPFEGDLLGLCPKTLRLVTPEQGPQGWGFNSLRVVSLKLSTSRCSYHFLMPHPSAQTKLFLSQTKNFVLSKKCTFLLVKKMKNDFSTGKIFVWPKSHFPYISQAKMYTFSLEQKFLSATKSFMSGTKMIFSGQKDWA